MTRRKTRVLVVEDGITMRMFFRDVLERAGFEVEEAVNGLEGVERAMTGSFDLLVVDINMPKMDGYQVIRTVREDETLWRIPVSHHQHGRQGAGCSESLRRRGQLLPDQAGPSEGPRGNGAAAYRDGGPMTTLLERFIPEAREHLETAAAGLLKLERDPSNEGLVNEVFRAVHTLKGSSGLFDVPGLTRLLHAGEDLLRCGPLEPPRVRPGDGRCPARCPRPGVRVGR